MKKKVFVVLSVALSLTICACDNTNQYESSSHHEHTFGLNWEYNTTTHWHPSLCGHDVKKDESEHIFEDTYVELKGIERYTLRTCVFCKYSYKDYTPTNFTYTVTWVNRDGSILEIDNNVSYGTIPTYDGATPSYYGNGTSADDKYKFTFSGWSPEISPVESDCTYVACYERSEKTFKITWKNWDGTILEVDEGVAYKAWPRYNSQTPTRENNQEYTYTFDSWRPELTYATADAVYTAHFAETINEYTVTWKNADGTVLEVDSHVPYGTMPSYDGPTPSKKHSSTNDFVFSGWDKEISIVTQDQVYIATFEETERQSFDISFNLNGGTNFNDNTIIKQRDVSFVFPYNLPSRSGYAFVGWNSIYEPKTYMPGDAFEGNFDVVFWAMWERKEYCSKCDGEGYYTITCSNCFGRGTTSHPCSSCGGTGLPRYTCKNCNSTVSRTYYEYGQCPYCQVWNRIDIFYDCPYCERGSIFETCNVCNGDKTVTVTCEVCSGAGGWFEDKPAPELKEADYTTVELVKKDGYEYSLGGENWQSSTFFDGLKPNKTYLFYQRKATNEDIPFGITSNPLSVSTKTTPIYRIEYDLDGGVNDPANPDSYTAFDNVFFASPTKKGYEFGGWFKDGYPIESIPLGSVGDIRIEARWTALKNNLTIASNDSSRGTVSILSGTGYSGEEIIVKAEPFGGFVFTGWYNGPVKVSDLETYTFIMPGNDYLLTGRFYTPEELENEEHGIASGTIPDFKSDNTVTYGLYPQSNVDDANLISELNNLSSQESNGWYQYNGNYYAKADATPCDSYFKFDNGTIIANGTTYWFKCELINWSIVSNDKGQYTLLSSKLLDAHMFDASSSNYEDSSIRNWLNGSFYDSAFSFGNDYIKTTVVDNSVSTTSWDGGNNTYNYNNTEDKVFLLSLAEFETVVPKSSLICNATDWARANGAWSISHDSNNRAAGDYWTRSPYDRTEVWVITTDNYNNNYLACDYRAVNPTGICVRPAISIKMDNL